MKDYPQLAHDYKDQVLCILLRNTSATDAGNKFPYNTKGFEGLNTRSYMFFRVPNDLSGLDIANGQCLNQSIPQNVTFKMQAEVLGLSGVGRRESRGASWGALVLAVLVAALVGW